MKRETRFTLHPAPGGGAPGEYVLIGGPGEPTRTWEDMRLALSGQLQRHLNRFPDPAGEVDDALAYRAASLITGDHYAVPGTVALTREHALRYVALARQRS